MLLMIGFFNNRFSLVILRVQAEFGAAETLADRSRCVLNQTSEGRVAALVGESLST